MKRVNGLIRILSSMIDLLIVFIPVFFVMIMVFHVTDSQAELLMKLLFAVYSVLFMEYTKGYTIGKYFGKIIVVTEDGLKPTLTEYGMRELIKTLYFIPWIGWFLAFLSTLLLFFGKGKTIHDRIAKTTVIYLWDKPKEVSNELS